METTVNIAYGCVQVNNSLQPTAEPFYELVSEPAKQKQMQATTSLPEKVKAGKKSVYIFTTVVIVVALVMALLALVHAVIAIVSNQEIQSLQSEMNSLIALMSPLGTFQNPASSCRDIHLPNSPSGEYWILTNNLSSPVQVYCDKDRSNCNCNDTGGWTRVAYLDMTDPSQQCPDGFRLVSRTTAPLRTCRRTGQAGCVSTTYHTYGVEYSHVCGQIRGYQDGTPDAFGLHHLDNTHTIDSNYVDGVSLTHGQSPRQHIWTFAAAVDEIRSSVVTCPCTQSVVPYTGTVPPFIGQDYFCATGSRDAVKHIFYPDDPLWDGQGCGGNSTCCQFNNPPWFCKQLSQPTTDDIELRLCTDENRADEDIPLELVEIYVH